MSNNLPKQILNYFATFTETRFNFRRLINYKWTDNEYTLDLSLFPDFEKKLLDSVRSGNCNEFKIIPNEYILKLTKSEIQLELQNLFLTKYTTEQLDTYINEEIERVKEENPVNAIEQNIIWNEATRRLNLEIRKDISDIITCLQEKCINRHKEEYGVSSFPSPSFGMNNYLKKHFDALQSLAKTTQSPSEFINISKIYFEENIDDVVLYDLFYNLHSYSAFVPMGTLYLFFHSIGKDDNSFPLYFSEVDMRLSNPEITLSFTRNLVLVNTPGINYFKFDRVLTTPRASSFDQVKSNLGAVEVFLQSQYGYNQSFILEPIFKEIVSDSNNHPKIGGRIGFQIVQKEDKKLLDYSEIMTNIELNGNSQFDSFVDSYIKGTVPNHQFEVDSRFQKEFPLTSPRRSIPDGPLPLNASQRRILLALSNNKNKVIVVDGPPGTGKSHTIAALVYQANAEGKSVAITSHKTEALDVIDRMMTDKYKSLHPQSKPSIARMDSETGSANTLHNTLTTSVVSAASTRILEYNEPAILADKEALENKLFSILSKRIENSSHEIDAISHQINFNILTDKVLQMPELSDAVRELLGAKHILELDTLNEFLKSFDHTLFTTTSLEELHFIISNKDKLHDFLEACEHLNTLPADSIDRETSIVAIQDGLLTCINDIVKSFKATAKLSQLSSKDSASGFFDKLTGKANKEETLAGLIQELKSLKYSDTIKELISLSDKDTNTATVNDLFVGLERAKEIIALRKYKIWIDDYKKIDGNNSLSVHEMFIEVSKYSKNINIFNDETYHILFDLFDNYGKLLEVIGITKTQLSTLKNLSIGNERDKLVFEWICNHSNNSSSGTEYQDHSKLVNDYSRIQQKELEHKNDLRLSELNQHLGVMQQIKVSYEGGKRFTKEQSNILLKSISVIISEPSTISKYFPMEEDLIDVLIIDEASQVSIADSISLILRAKQVVIFGDEYQYGAVSAVNVSTKYSASYFTDIINAYADDYKIAVSEKAREDLVREISKEINEDEVTSDTLLRPQDNPGAVLWLKTFDIRTSTLTFAKAIANYTTSLREHFRSFPEIIHYSNEFFYKPAQQELTVNRIRTKPIQETLVFMPVTTKGKAGANTNLDEIDAIISDIQKRIDNGFKGTIGIIVSFREQQLRLEEALNERFNLAKMRLEHKLSAWFVGDVQGEERDIIYYSFVEDQGIQNADLRSIYPVIGGSADSIRSLKMQRLNVGFSRAKDTMVFVHSQEIDKYSNTRLGDALKHYRQLLEQTTKNDFFIADESIFDSPKEKELYQMLLQTDFFANNKHVLRIVPQFPIGEYLRAEFAAQIPKYRSDFLLVLSENGKERTLILEYDGLDFHFKDPASVSANALSREFIDYDISRQLELESYGYRFLRINTFTLRPEKEGDTPTMILNRLLINSFTK